MNIPKNITYYGLSLLALLVFLPTTASAETQCVLKKEIIYDDVPINIGGTIETDEDLVDARLNFDIFETGKQNGQSLDGQTVAIDQKGTGLWEWGLEFGIENNRETITLTEDGKTYEGVFEIKTSSGKTFCKEVIKLQYIPHDPPPIEDARNTCSHSPKTPTPSAWLWCTLFGFALLGRRIRTSP